MNTASEHRSLIERTYQSGTFKLIIPKHVEDIIRHLCNRVHEVEWSGILFYYHKGSWENDDLEITCEDILPMDIGSSTYTDFKMSPDVISYMTEHDLLDCECGLIHSHNNMRAFFSGTDLNTLSEEGNDRNHFVSLIVNNEGNYVAAVTRKLQFEETSVIKCKYNSFKNEEFVLYTDKEDSKSYTKVEYSMLDIIKEGHTSNFEEIDNRLQSIKEEKNKVNVSNTYKTAPSRTYYDWYTEKNDLPKPLGTVYENVNDTYFKSDRIVSESEVVIPEEFVKLTAARLLTCSMTLVGASKFDFEAWIAKMDTLCEKAFEDVESYKYFIDMFSEFIIYDTAPESLCNKYNLLKEIIGEYLLNEVLKFLEELPECKYSKILLTQLMSMAYGFNE